MNNQPDRLDSTPNFSSNVPLLLVSHGSRHPGPQAAMTELAQQVHQALSLVSHTSFVGTAYLELHSLPLSEQIYQFADRAWSSGFQRIQILPLFLHLGVHTHTDIPAAVTQAQTSFGPQVAIELLPYLGSHPGLLDLIQVKMTLIKCQAWILLAHGSRRPLGNQPIKVMAQKLQAIAMQQVIDAYWSVSPTLEARISDFVRDKHQQIGIIPYFLFEGGITEAINQQVNHLSQQFPQVKLYLGEALGVSPELVNLITDLSRKTVLCQSVKFI